MYYFKNKMIGVGVMGLSLFILGTLIFISLGALVTFWVFTGFPEDYFYRTFGCIYTMGILELSFYFFGASVFGSLIQNRILFGVSILFFLFLLLYCFLYCIFDKVRPRLLLILPLLGFELWLLINSYKKTEIAFDSYNIIIIVSTFYSITLISYFFQYLRRRSQRRIKSDLLYTRYSRSNLDFPFEWYIHNSDLSGNVSDKISLIVVKLYLYAKEDRLSPGRLEDFLERYEEIISPSIQKRIVNRFMESHYLNRMESVNLIEFATLLFPEFFGRPQSAFISESYNLRLYEEYYSLFQKIMKQNQDQLDAMDLKIDKIQEIISGGTIKLEKNTALRNDSSSALPLEEAGQSIVREIFHLTKTPLLTINAAVRNLSNPNEPLSKIQREKLTTIEDNVLTVKLIIEAYRKLATASEAATSEAIVPHIETAFASMCNLCNKQLKAAISDFPEKISVHGNNVIIILLMPLIHNAIEAAPDASEIAINCLETDEYCKITVENICESVPKQSNLKKDGYSTKSGGGEGLRSVRRISKSIGIDFRINVYSKEKKVVAILTVPKK